MDVTMVQVGVMRVLVHNRRVPVPMAVRLARRVARAVAVLVVLVMHVPVLVFERLMTVLVVVGFRQVQVHANRHEGCGNRELNRNRVAEHGDGNSGTDEWCS
jgi:hypothetical protein